MGEISSSKFQSSALGMGIQAKIFHHQNVHKLPHFQILKVGQKWVCATCKHLAARFLHEVKIIPKPVPFISEHKIQEICLRLYERF